jgi:hypothetical protein
MSTLVDVRPPALDVLFRPGNTLTATLNWPAGELTGRTFSAELNGTALTTPVSIVGDVMTVIVTDTETGALAVGVEVEFELDEDIGGTDEPVIVGTWTPSNDAAAVSSTTIEVTSGGATVEVTVAGFGGSVGDLAVGGDLTMAEATIVGDGTVDGGVIRAHSLQIPWDYTLDHDPTSTALGTAIYVDADVTIEPGGNPLGPQFQTGYFGPRGIFNLEGLVRYARDMTILGFAPVGYYDALTIANDAGNARDLAPSWSFLSARSTVADGALCELVGTDVNAGGAAFVDAAVYGSTDGGELDGLTHDYELVSFLSMPGLFGDSSIRRRIAFDVMAAFEGIHPIIPEPEGPHWSGVGDFDPTAPTLDEEIGLRIQEFTLGATKIGVQSVHPVVADEGFYGGRDAGDDLILGSTLHATRGQINARDPINVLTEALTHTEPEPVRLVEWAGTVTLDDPAGFQFGNELSGLGMFGTAIYERASPLGIGNLMSAAHTVKNPTGEARNLTPFNGLVMQVNVQADAAAVTAQAVRSVLDNAQFGVAGGGTLTATEWTGVELAGSIGAGATVTTRRGLWVKDPAGVGALGTMVGVDIAALTKATTDIGIRNASTEVATPSSAFVDAASDTITINAKAKRVGNLSNPNVPITLTSTPTIPNGVADGQVAHLWLYTGADVTIQDEANLAGSNVENGGTDVVLSLGGRGVTIVWSFNRGSWVVVG